MGDIDRHTERDTQRNIETERNTHRDIKTGTKGQEQRGGGGSTGQHAESKIKPRVLWTDKKHEAEGRETRQTTSSSCR